MKILEVKGVVIAVSRDVRLDVLLDVLHDVVHGDGGGGGEERTRGMKNISLG